MNHSLGLIIESLVAVLLIRPAGLFGPTGGRRV